MSSEALKAAKHRYYMRNKEKFKADARKWRTNNLEYVRAKAKQYYEDHKDAFRTYNAEYAEINRRLYIEDGEALREARKRSGMTQAALAKQIGVNQSSISNWETARVPIPWEDVLPVFPTLQERSRKYV